MRKFFYLFFVCLLLSISLVLSLVPFGANVTVVNSSRATPDDPTGVNAQAGNVTELNIQGYSTTQSWQGYYGNVSGAVVLSDSQGKALYNWTLASPNGEVYASENDSIDWTTVQCFNFTAAGNYGDDSLQAGGTSLYGMNVSQLESRYNIEPWDVDGVEETFPLLGPGTHDLFYTNSREFGEGECRSTRLFNSSGTGENNKFEEVLLYSSLSRAVIFTAILEPDAFGFDNRTHDFEMMVLEDGHGTNLDSTPYYFYVELQ